MLNHKFKPIILRLKDYDYKGWFRKAELDNTRLEDDEKDKFVNLLPIPQLKSDEKEVKEGTRIKILTPSQILTRLPVLLVQQKLWIIHVN